MADEFNIIAGTRGGDRIEATELADRIRANGGSDAIFAYDGNHLGDEIFGGRGNDSLLVGPRSSFSYEGHDFFSGAGFLFDGGSGADRVTFNHIASGPVELDLTVSGSFNLEIGNADLRNIDALQIWTDEILDISLEFLPLSDTDTGYNNFWFASAGNRRTPDSYMRADFSAFDDTNIRDFGGGSWVPGEVMGLVPSNSGYFIPTGGGSNRNSSGYLVELSAETVEIIGTQQPDRFTRMMGSVNILYGEGGADFFDNQYTTYRGGSSFFGGTGDDTFVGGDYGRPLNRNRNEYYGEEGNDTFEDVSSEWALFDGGEGHDVVIFRSQVRINMSDQSRNGLEARGLTLVDIEEFDLQGGSRFRGSAADETISVQPALQVGLDTDIFGRGGNDTFVIGPTTRLGRFTDDTFFFSGGNGRDTLHIFNGNQTFAPVVFDLQNRHNSTGFATQVQVSSIENVRGSHLNESLFGNQGHNHLFGERGHDVLDGRDGRDRLDGGIGNDTLTGGSGRDTFIFARTYDDDTITDFIVGRDRIELSSRLLGRQDTAEGVIDRFATVVNGRVEFDFGRGDYLVLENVTSLEGLADSLIIV